jgi:hypothetical protein
MAFFGDNRMNNVADHPCPCMPTPVGATKMIVDVGPFGMPGCVERLVVEPSPAGGFVVACLPFFSYGIQFGDLVEVQERGQVFERVVKSSGLRTLRIAFRKKDTARHRHERIHGELVKSGLPHEWRGFGYVSVLVRDLSDQERALSCVADDVRDGTVSWEVDPAPFSVPPVDS